jgi:hypothetical protein
VLNKEAVVDKASKVVLGALGKVVPTKTQPVVKLLSPREQVDRFLSMSDTSLQRIKSDKGDLEYTRYVTAMTSLAKELYG